MDIVLPHEVGLVDGALEGRLPEFRMDQSAEVVGLAWAYHQRVEAVLAQGRPVLVGDDVESLHPQALRDLALLVKGQFGVGPEVDLP